MDIETTRLNALLKRIGSTIDYDHLLSDYVQRKLPFIESCNAPIQCLPNLDRLKRCLYRAINESLGTCGVSDQDWHFLLSSLNQIQVVYNKYSKQLWDAPAKMKGLPMPEMTAADENTVFSAGTSRQGKQYSPNKLNTLWHKVMEIFDFSDTSESKALESSFELHALILELLLIPSIAEPLHALAIKSAEELETIKIMTKPDMLHDACIPSVLASTNLAPRLDKQTSIDCMKLPQFKPGHFDSQKLVMPQFSRSLSPNQDEPICYLSYIEDATGTIRWGYAPPVVAIFHELLHALNYLRGTNHHDEIITGRFKEVWSTREEWQVINLDTPCENTLRKLLGLHKRISHQGEKITPGRTPLTALKEQAAHSEIIDLLKKHKLAGSKPLVNHTPQATAQLTTLPQPLQAQEPLILPRLHNSPSQPPLRRPTMTDQQQRFKGARTTFL